MENNEIQTIAIEAPTEEAKKLVTRFMWYSGGVGIIPMPIVDFVGVTALQLKVVHDLAKIYGLPFNKEIARAIISTMLAGVTTGALASGTASFLRSIPLVGGILGFATIGLYAMATTYAIGHIFIQHFETGGTLLTFKPEKMRAHFEELYNNGKEIASSMMNDKMGVAPATK
jgi:uncharacterized protein (DUF697 family)